MSASKTFLGEGKWQEVSDTVEDEDSILPYKQYADRLVETHLLLKDDLTREEIKASDFFPIGLSGKVESIDGINSCTVNLVYEPEWDVRMMSDEAKLELGFDMD